MKGIKLKQKLVTLPGFYIVGMEYLGSHEHKGEIGKLWDRFVKKMKSVENQVEPMEEIGYCYATPEMVQNDQMRYIAGVKVKNMKKIPLGMVGAKVLAQDYAVFTHRGPVEKISASYDYIYGAWFPKSGMEPADAPDFERYDKRFKPDSEDSELDLYVPVVAS